MIMLTIVFSSTPSIIVQQTLTILSFRFVRYVHQDLCTDLAGFFLLYTQERNNRYEPCVVYKYKSGSSAPRQSGVRLNLTMAKIYKNNGMGNATIKYQLKSCYSTKTTRRKTHAEIQQTHVETQRERERETGRAAPRN